jgi:hypothetical protein
VKAQALSLGLALALLGGCTHSVHQVAMGEFDDVPAAARLRPIEAETSQDVFLATGNTDFADEAMAELAQRCPRGRVVGIQARHSTSLGFLVHTNRMKITGYCLEDAPSPSVVSSKN